MEALDTLARCASEFLIIERAVSQGKGESHDFVRISPWPWLAYLDDEDLQAFVAELRDSFVVAFKTGTTAPMEQLIEEWRVTAETLSDPARRQVLLEPFAEDAYVEARSPEQIQSEELAEGSDAEDSGSC